NTEVPLRLPGVLAFLALGPVTFALSRRFLGPLASLLVAAATVANSGILTYGLQLKPFTLEALGAELAVLLWFEADGPDATLGEQLSFVWHGLSSYVPGILVGEPAGHPEVTRAFAFGPTAVGMFVPFLVAALLLGVATALRSGPGRVLVSVLLFALVGQLVA